MECSPIQSVLFNTSWEEHLEHLEIVFNRFKSDSLKIKLSKCQIFKKQLHYLGQKISAEMVGTTTREAGSNQELSTSQEHR